MRAPLAAAAVAGALGFVALHATAGPYRLPWAPGTAMDLTQDCNDSRFDDHVASRGYAWDFANGGEFSVLAARAGTVTHVKMSSAKGCDNASCVDLTNYIVIDHGDGTASIYLHLAQGSLDPSVRCGEFVRQGQRLATAAATGFATGPHLHFQVNVVRSDQSSVCECGPDGLACPASFAQWGSFWSTPGQPSVPIRFDEWEADTCQDRSLSMPVSLNAEPSDSTYVIDDSDPAHFSVTGTSATARMPGPGYGGSYRVALTEAAGGPTATAEYAFGDVVDRPGVYEVWAYVPLRRAASTRRAKLSVVARGGRNAGLLDESVVGGAFHPVAKVGRLKLTGTRGESVRLTNDTGERGRTIAFDAMMLRRVSEPGPGRVGDACASSVECTGTLVCGEGRCVDGCEIAGCPRGQTCEVTGMCAPVMGTAKKETGGASKG